MLDPKNWIDQQRQAGEARGNVFVDILVAAQDRRRQRGEREDGSAERTERIKRAARRYDTIVDNQSRMRE